MDFTSGDGAGGSGDARVVEVALKALWERARRAGEVITSLRQENAGLRSDIQEMHARVLRLEEEVSSRKQQGPGAEPEQGTVVFKNGERELLITRVKELLVKLEAYL